MNIPTLQCRPRWQAPWLLPRLLALPLTLALYMLALTLMPTSSAAAPTASAAEAEEVVVYSARNEHLIKPLFDAYTAHTGTEIRYTTDNEASLLARLLAEGESTPADIMLTVDAGNLWQAAQQGVLAAVESDILQANIPAHLRDADGHWFGLSVRARTMVYAPQRVAAEALGTYEALAEPQWQGRLCLRTSKKVYNQSLVAMLIARHGEAHTEEIVRGWVSNLATEPFANDTQAIQAVAAGQCDVAVVNSYYYGRLLKEDPEFGLAVFWPNQEAAEQDASGVHVNISGAGITRHAKNPAAALALLEWLSGSEAQALFASLNLEFPANPDVAADPVVAAWGEFRQDPLNVAKAGELQADAVRLMDRAGYR